MEVLLDVLLTVHLSDWGFGDNMISVVESIVLHIMAKSSDDER
jgi:hypothetical protein